jgi:acyl-CoA synthetase (AMP-forming)/AMP-acid ligase II
MSGATLQQMLARAARVPGTGIRFVDAAERERFFEWRELARRARGVAAGLARAGVEPGDRVAIVFPTRVEFFDAFFGTLAAGAVPVPLYPPVRLGRLEEYTARTAAMLDAAGAVLALADPRLLPFLGEAVARVAPRLGCRTLDALPRATDERTVEGAPDDLALVQFSSGTTVDPKPVALEQRAVVAQVRALSALWSDDREVVHSDVSWLPLYHDMGLVGAVFPALDRPAVLTLLAPESFVVRPALWLRAIARQRATISVAPNFAYALAAERIRADELEGCDLSCWQSALCGAETVSAVTLRRFADRFARWGFRAEALTPVYGLSEAALAVTFSELGRGVASRRYERTTLAAHGRAVALASEPEAAAEDAAGVELVSVGRPLPGFALELRDALGRPVAERTIGRLFVRGPSLFRGYLGRPEATAAALAGGWLDTGDLGFTDDGELFLTGRAKDVLVLRGQNHAPDEVERALDGVPGVRRGCVAAVSDRADGEDTDRLLLFVELQRGTGPPERAALPARAREAVLAACGLAPDEIHLLAPGTLPRTSSGKIRRRETLVRHLAGTLSPPASVGPIALARAAWRGRRALAAAERKRGKGR